MSLYPAKLKRPLPLGVEHMDVAGVEDLRLLFPVQEGVDSPVLRRKGVRPDEDELVDGVTHCVDGPGSENRTRFLVRFGVWGGVEIP